VFARQLECSRHKFIVVADHPEPLLQVVVAENALPQLIDCVLIHRVLFTWVVGDRQGRHSNSAFCFDRILRLLREPGEIAQSSTSVEALDATKVAE